MPTLGPVNIVVLLIPILRPIEVNLIGRLFLPEIILTALLPFLLLARGRILRNPLPFVFLALVTVWLFGQITTDLMQGTPSQDYLRGWARILFTTACFASIYLLINNRRDRIALYFLGVVIGLLVDFFLAPSEYAARHPWKFGLASPITFGVFLLAAYSGKFPLLSTRFAPTAMAAAIGLINLYMGYRSLGGICLMVSIYLAIWPLFATSNKRPKKLKLRTVVGFSILILASGFTVVETFSFVAKTGYLGADAQRKFQFQGTGEFGLLLGGRQEIFVSARAVRENPVFGHGSWAKDPEFTYHYAIFELRRQLGYPTNEYISHDLLPTHSHLFGSWVEAGILGAVFWIWIATLGLRALALLYRCNDPMVPLFVFMAFHLLWDIIFSPFGAEARFTTTFVIISLMWVIENQDAVSNPTARAA